MIGFEKWLIEEKGYLKFLLDTKEWRYKRTEESHLSSMWNLDYRYFLPDDPILVKIDKGEIVGKGISLKDRKGEIVIGLSEKNSPPTLCEPRPNIKVHRLKEGKKVIEYKDLDNSMNVILDTFAYEEIYNAMYNPKIILEVDLT